jgi:uncharacterized integral membrane protein (TIGR00698 family)
MPLKLLFILLAIAVLHPWVSAPLALAVGIVFSLILGNPFSNESRKLTPKLLSYSIIGLGAGMNLIVVGRVGLNGILYTAVGIVSTLLLGLWLGSRFSISKGASTLISCGTAICGGSAIAAVAPVIRAKPEEVSISLAVVFVLNAIALLIFPMIGHSLNLTQVQFGLWSALSIHDTSSVVGASMQFGKQALEVGTTVKLARALWIIPVTLFFAYRMKRVQDDSSAINKPTKKPWFILGFLAMAALMTWIPTLQPYGQMIEWIARRLLILTLFLIGAGLNAQSLKAMGHRTLLQALLLWFITASVSLLCIQQHWIQL